jgi:hypothetical protein
MRGNMCVCGGGTQKKNHVQKKEKRKETVNKKKLC